MKRHGCLRARVTGFNHDLQTCFAAGGQCHFRHGEQAVEHNQKNQ